MTAPAALCGLCGRHGIWDGRDVGRDGRRRVWCIVCGSSEPLLPREQAERLRREAEAGERGLGRPSRIVAPAAHFQLYLELDDETDHQG